MSDTPSLGWRWIAACHRADVEPWAAGMLAIPTTNAAHDPPARVLDPVEGVVAWFDGSANDGDLDHADVPDLSDPATVGAAIGVLRAWSGDPTIHLKAEYFRTEGWLWVIHGASVTYWQRTPSEAEAIVAAAEHMALAAGGGR